MDRIESLSNTISNMTMYDLKSMYNQAKNVVLNISEMEAKVREATNDDPWGASSTIMQEIAQGTFSFQHFNEIMPCIYARFMEKEARQWRQIYKALQLLEYIIKHGSERVVDDARSHISTIKMLRNFHYIDDKGKDEGANVRNRARELVDLLMDVEKIRTERRKAKANKHKYIGTGNDGFAPMASGGRYSGFGSDSYGFPNGNSYSSNDFYSGSSALGGNGNGSGSGGGTSGRSGGFRDSFGRRDVPEYDAGDDELQPGESTPSRSNSLRTSPAITSTTARKVATPPAAAPAPAPAPVNLLDLDDFGSVPAAQVNKALPSTGFDDDEFADFQAAPVSPTTAATAPAQPGKPNLMDLLNSNTTATARQPQQQQMGGMVPTLAGPPGHRSSSSISAPGRRTSSPLTTAATPSIASTLSQPTQPTQSLFGAAPLQPMSPLNAGFGVSMASPPMASVMQPQVAGQLRPTQQPLQAQVQGQALGQAQKKPATANFDDLWSMSLGGTSSPTAASFNTSKVGAAAGAVGGKSISDLQKEKSSAGLWGAPAAGAAKPMMGGGLGGGARAPAPPANSGSFGGGDDLLL